MILADIHLPTIVVNSPDIDIDFGDISLQQPICAPPNGHDNIDFEDISLGQLILPPLNMYVQ